MRPLKLAVLISGRGTNLQALIDACADPGYPAEIAIVISNRPEAPGLDRATAADLKSVTIDHKAFADRAAFDAALDDALKAAGVDLICLAGFMRLFTAEFVNGWADAIINIHPALLPAFKGARPHSDVLAAGVRISGCTVHVVRPEMDSGPIIVQAAVPVLKDDDEASLAARVLTAEHICYPMAVRMIAEGRGEIRGDRWQATTVAAPDPAAILINPPPA